MLERICNMKQRGESARTNLQPEGGMRVLERIYNLRDGEMRVLGRIYNMREIRVLLRITTWSREVTLQNYNLGQRDK